MEDKPSFFTGYSFLSSLFNSLYHYEKEAVKNSALLEKQTLLINYSFNYYAQQLMLKALLMMIVS